MPRVPEEGERPRLLEARDSLARITGLTGTARRSELRPLLKRSAILLALIAALLVAGTIAFNATEDISLWRAFVMTLDTVTAVGGEPSPQDTDGQIVKVMLIVLGVGTLFFALVTTAEFFVAGHLTGLMGERRTLRKIQDLSDHHLICGFGRVGRAVARDLRAGGDSFVVIDDLPENKEIAEGMKAPFVLGRPSDDEMLKAAGIDRARSVLASVDSDAENIFICLTARELRSDITIVARASVEDSEKKLLRAGADRVISPYKSSGAEMARLALHPQVAGVVDVAPEYRMEEIEVTQGCDAAGKAVGDVSGSAVVVALRKADGKVHPQPPAESRLHPGDVVVAMGTTEALTRLEEMFTPPRPARLGPVADENP